VNEPNVVEPPTDPTPPWAGRVAQLRSTLRHLPVPAVVAGAAGLGVVAIVTVVVLSVLHRSSAAPALALPRAGGTGTAASPPPSGGDQAPADAGASPAAGETVTVHAAGAVARPGVYVLPGRARVADLLAAAGGALAEADVDQLNLAAKLTDAERIYVPHKGEAPAPAVGDSATGGASSGSGGSTATGPIDLNAATAAQLDVLPGVGPTTAKAIVAYRSAHGGFRSVTDLLAVPGIGPAKLDAIRPLVTVTSR
jgi:competence protein ComEA